MWTMQKKCTCIKLIHPFFLWISILSSDLLLCAKQFVPRMIKLSMIVIACTVGVYSLVGNRGTQIGNYNIMCDKCYNKWQKLLFIYVFILREDFNVIPRLISSPGLSQSFCISSLSTWDYRHVPAGLAQQKCFSFCFFVFFKKCF